MLPSKRAGPLGSPTSDDQTSYRAGHASSPLCMYNDYEQHMIWAESAGSPRHIARLIY